MIGSELGAREFPRGRQPVIELDTAEPDARAHGEVAVRGQGPEDWRARTLQGWATYDRPADTRGGPVAVSCPPAPRPKRMRSKPRARYGLAAPGNRPPGRDTGLALNLAEGPGS